MHTSPGIFLTDEGNPGKPHLGYILKAVRPVIDSLDFKLRQSDRTNRQGEKKKEKGKLSTLSEMICHSFRRRCWKYSVAEGGHFEHVRA